MPPHSSHLLQPLDLLFWALQTLLWPENPRDGIIVLILLIKWIFSLSIHQSIDVHFQQPIFQADSELLALITLDPEKVISKLVIKLKDSKTPTPPFSSNSNQSFHLGKTPLNLLSTKSAKTNSFKCVKIKSSVHSSIVG
jgi:hypothetical protein